ncbi:sensor histidine kinase [Nocardiopsis quinghaiensis]|uniref:sensor histidine kinase n=1 Tax=Nocardiopsis quinghaiensis TaxID=464995 RepID=UPI00123ADA0C|nr:sensor histidine kinase [Nocardiopsis quinghaiensis]
MALNRASALLARQLTLVDGGLPRLTAWAVAVLLVAAWSGDLATTLQALSADVWLGPPRDFMYFLPLVSGGLATGVALAALLPRTGPALTTAAGAGAALLTVAASAVLWPLDKGTYGYSIALSEGAAVLTTLSLVALRGRVWQVGLVSLLAFAALLSDYLREPFFWPGRVTTALLVAGVGLVPGLYLRWRDARHSVRVEAVRAQERLAIARDLHDVVAHEVTGIVVQAQALRHIADRDPGAVRTALPEIEAAGARALASMRGMVSRLREPDDVPLAPDTTGGLARLEAPATSGRPGVRVRYEGPVDALPPAVGTTVLRIAQESVTNALRHARGASRVDVVVEAGADGVRVEVRDDGRGTAGPVDGFGLTGMAERVRLLDGEFSAGPHGRGPGWEVRAWLPLGGRG